MPDNKSAYLITDGNEVNIAVAETLDTAKKACAMLESQRSFPRSLIWYNERGSLWHYGYPYGDADDLRWSIEELPAVIEPSDDKAAALSAELQSILKKMQKAIAESGTEEDYMRTDNAFIKALAALCEHIDSEGAEIMWTIVKAWVDGTPNWWWA